MGTLAHEPLSKIMRMPAEKVAESLSSNEFASGGTSNGLRVLTVYLAYAGRRLSASRRQTLERARDLLLQRSRRALVED